MTGLLFSNFVFAELEGKYEKKCKVEYTQLDLILGQETIYKKTTSSFRDDYYCETGFEKLSEKVSDWVYKNNTNVVIKISDFRCQIRNYNDWKFDFSYGFGWGNYRKCDTYIERFVKYLVDKHPDKIGAGIYKEFDKIQASGSN